MVETSFEPEKTVGVMQYRKDQTPGIICKMAESGRHDCLPQYDHVEFTARLQPL